MRYPAAAPADATVRRQRYRGAVESSVSTNRTEEAAAPYPRIPYGEVDFRRIRLNRWLYVDKTRFLRRLEQERYVCFIRPRRFGKSCWVSLLENYYDRYWGHEFDAVFSGTDIGRRPTGERHRYVVLRFDFSAVNDAPETLEREFDAYCHIELRGTLRRHPDLFPAAAAQDILTPPSTAAKLAELFRYAGDEGIPLYVLIDEYDNFANTVLSVHGEEAYHAFTHGGGFYRNFFATLKAGTARSGGGIERLFITGVSPITLDDVTSGFNIGTNLSLNPQFNEMLGFTEAEGAPPAGDLPRPWCVQSGRRRCHGADARSAARYHRRGTGGCRDSARLPPRGSSPSRRTSSRCSTTSAC